MTAYRVCLKYRDWWIVRAPNADAVRAAVGADSERFGAVDSMSIGPIEGGDIVELDLGTDGIFVESAESKELRAEAVREARRERTP